MFHVKQFVKLLNLKAMKNFKYTKQQIKQMIDSLDNLDIIHDTQSGLIRTSFSVMAGKLSSVSQKYNDADWCVGYEFDIEKNIDWLYREFGNATNFINAITHYCYVLSAPVK